MTEYAPPPPKVRVTKAQLKQVQENYRKAQELAEDLSEEEKKIRERELKKVEKKLEDVL
ncbi:hypothetical protein LAT59_02465 [Candidatus Gracilibacteria bacterium]|nr:hypothetical protein [Candidatus Gracilibacteria bacterium]